MNRRKGKPDLRGNNRDRRNRKLWMLRTFDPDLGPSHCRCFNCRRILTYISVTADRILPGCKGGRYVRTNLRPACLLCNESQGAKMWSTEQDQTLKEE